MIRAISVIEFCVRHLVRSTTKYTEPMLSHFVLPQAINRILRVRVHVGALFYTLYINMNMNTHFTF